ncbi:MAG: hypothetical protein GX638_06140 [Crenarchaeota archaeon]|nr:hypothetical protein [Thermoproteota archaeon]
MSISQEEAIIVAREQAQKLLEAYGVISEEDSQTSIELLDEPVDAELMAIAKEPLTLYPFWFIQLYIGPNEGGVTGVQVGIWADTGEIEYCHPSGIHGILSNETFAASAQLETTNQASSNNIINDGESQQIITIYIIMAAVAVTITALITTAMIIAKRKRK